jgi:hypothetical protein
MHRQVKKVHLQLLPRNRLLSPARAMALTEVTVVAFLAVMLLMELCQFVMSELFQFVMVMPQVAMAALFQLPHACCRFWQSGLRWIFLLLSTTSHRLV